MMNKAKRKEKCERALYDSFMSLFRENTEIKTPEQRIANIETMIKLYLILFQKKELAEENLREFIHTDINGTTRKWVDDGSGWKEI